MRRDPTELKESTVPQLGFEAAWLGATGGTLTIVRAGPYPTSDAAAADATRLIRAGLEAVVTSPK